jgi:D-glycero-alpha-D-manno-heptose-7-phosphate kinase
MLIAQAPLRVSLFGGGSDLPAFLRHNTGSVLSFAIDRRVFLVGHPFTHRDGIQLKYSKTENVSLPSELEHPIAREVLDRYGIRNFDLAVMADVPAGTGLGSSSSFTVAFLALVRHLCGIPTNPVDLAKEACEIEIEILKEPIGYQDQWASALGGINVLTFEGANVGVESLTLPATKVQELEQRLRLVPAGNPRSASELLKEQSQAIEPGSKAEFITQEMVKLVELGRAAIASDLDSLGPLLHEGWSLKKEVSPSVSSPTIDELYEKALKAGATGGKLLGAGGSGYLALYVPNSKSPEFDSVFPQQLSYHISSTGAGVIHES